MPKIDDDGFLTNMEEWTEKVAGVLVARESSEPQPVPWMHG